MHPDGASIIIQDRMLQCYFAADAGNIMHAINAMMHWKIINLQPQTAENNIRYSVAVAVRG